MTEKKRLVQPIAIVPKNIPIVMEVVGEKGQKIMEYVDTGDDEEGRPYHILHERHQLDS